MTKTVPEVMRKILWLILTAVVILAVVSHLVQKFGIFGTVVGSVLFVAAAVWVVNWLKKNVH